MSDLTKLTLKSALDGLAEKRFSAEELTRAHVSAVEAARPLNAYVLETPDKALDMARASGARRARGAAGALDG
ncbi:MAG TPA: Asp-tRNA(Asn)/Glu-tRNA(Gln) amidotransferase subunit GatA, partial [Phenylobacterium sp.]|nr:Asp-tRNA(Asn)/Glu-tRNA(Gln) amidotransferase subunit GatA [Phenylobacterium sp.]